MSDDVQQDYAETEDIKEVKSIFQCWTEAISRFFDIHGRTSRYEFWAFQFVSLLIFILAALCGFLVSSYKIIFEIFALYFIVPATATGIRRLHDVGLCGWWMAPAVVLGVLVLWFWEFETSGLMLVLFAFLSYITYLYWRLSMDGENCDNIYGNKVSEASVYEQDSLVFVGFMAVFLAVCWLVFFIKLF